MKEVRVVIQNQQVPFQSIEYECGVFLGDLLFISEAEIEKERETEVLYGAFG